MERMDRNSTHDRGRTIDTSNLRLLSRMDDFRVAKDNPDPRGWEVVGRDGKRIGKVDHLLVDPGARMVRYLGIDVDRSLLSGRGRGDHVLIPVDTAHLSHDHRDRVFIPESSTDLAALPIYDQSAIQSLLGRERGREERPVGREGERRVTLSEEELAVGKRTVSAGEVEIGKRVETEHVQKTVPVTREEVTIERRPITGAAAAGAGTSPRIQEDEIRIPLSHEEVVVEKRVIPKEEVVVKKHTVTGEERIDEAVRRERADIRGGENVREVGPERSH